MHNVKMHLDLASNGIMRCNGGRQQVKARFAEWSLFYFKAVMQTMMWFAMSRGRSLVLVERRRRDRL